MLYCTWRPSALTTGPHGQVPIGGDFVGISPIFLASEKSPGAIVCHCLPDPLFGRFGTVPACNKQMDRHTHYDSIYHASIALPGKN